MQNYNDTWEHQIITDQIKSEVVNNMHPVNNGGILDSECPKGKHYFLYTKYFQSYTYHQSFLLYSKLFSISSSEDLVHVFKFRGLSTCIIFKKKYRRYV